MELKALHKEPVEGFIVTTQDEDFYTWQVAIFGPPDTPYQGGYFKVSQYSIFSRHSMEWQVIIFKRACDMLGATYINVLTTEFPVTNRIWAELGSGLGAPLALEVNPG